MPTARQPPVKSTGTEPADYRWLFRKSPVMATSIGEDGVYRDVNDAFLARLGFEREQMVGHRPSEFVTAESALRIENELMPTLRRTGRLPSSNTRRTAVLPARSPYTTRLPT